MIVLPQAFVHLSDLKNWIEGDDVRRSLSIKKASLASLEDFISRVAPSFAEINAWLDAHDNEEAHSLGRLAEAACEAQLELRQRASNA